MQYDRHGHTDRAVTTDHRTTPQTTRQATPGLSGKPQTIAEYRCLMFILGTFFNSFRKGPVVCHQPLRKAGKKRL